MERPWSYYLLLVCAWLSGLWGLWLIGTAWLTWPADVEPGVREAARARLWHGPALIGVAALFGGLASVVRLLHDGVAVLAAGRVPAAVAAAAPAPTPTAAIETPAVRPRPAAAGGADPATEPPRLSVAIGADAPVPRADGPRLDPARRDAARRAPDDPPGRREPKLVPDA